MSTALSVAVQIFVFKISNRDHPYLQEELSEQQMSSETSHVSESEEEHVLMTQEREERALLALRRHFQHYTHLRDLRWLHDDRYYESFRDLIVEQQSNSLKLLKIIRDMEEDALRREERLCSLQEQMEEGFRAVRIEFADLKEGLTKGMSIIQSSLISEMSDSRFTGNRYHSRQLSSILNHNTINDNAKRASSLPPSFRLESEERNHDADAMQMQRFQMIMDGLVPVPDMSTPPEFLE